MSCSAAVMDLYLDEEATSEYTTQDIGHELFDEY